MILSAVMFFLIDDKNNQQDYSSDLQPDNATVNVLSEDKNMYVHFLNVGKADSTYLRCGNINILIDAADIEPKGKVVEYLKKQGVKKLDLVVLTHPHRDHMGQMSSVIETFEISKFLEPEIPNVLVPTTATYKRMLNSMKNKKINATTAKTNEIINLGDLKITILGPISKNSKNMNDNSIVMKVEYGDVSFLFMGDAEKSEEKELLKSGADLTSDVIKVGHHGSSSSTTEDFLKAVNPKYAAISVLGDETTPNKKVIERLKKFCGDNFHRTDRDGNIVFITDGKNINVKTEN